LVSISKTKALEFGGIFSEKFNNAVKNKRFATGMIKFDDLKNDDAL
jgi:hypothetical protein